MTGIFVMGYGLVAIPKQLWRTASIKGKERLLQHRAGVQAERTLAARRFVACFCFPSVWLAVSPLTCPTASLPQEELQRASPLNTIDHRVCSLYDLLQRTEHGKNRGAQGFRAFQPEGSYAQVHESDCRHGVRIW